MLRFEDWSVVVMGGLVVLASAGLLWRRRSGPENTSGSARWAWVTLLSGIGLLNSRWPHLLHVPYSVIMTMDTVNVLLAVGLLVLAVITWRSRSHE